MVEKVKKLFWF